MLNKRVLKKARRDVVDDLAELCRDLIRIPSLSGQEGRLAELARKRMKEFGYDKTSIDDIGNVIGVKECAKSRSSLLFEGHMDTVPPGERRNWRYDPFSGKIRGDSIFGRGSVDMKSSLAAMIIIPHILKAFHSKQDGCFATALAVLEEPCEGVGIRNVIEKGGLRPDAVVLGEPSDLSLALGQRGRFEISVRAHGRTCHSSMPERGVNAIYKMMPIISRLKSMNEHLPTHPLLGRASIAAFKIVSSPTEGNVVPDVCELLLDRRTLPGETRSKILKEIRKAVHHGSASARVGVDVCKRRLETYSGKKLEVEKAFPGWLLDKNHRLVDFMTQTVKEATGRPPILSTWRFGTDGTYTAGVRKIPTIGFGPGNPERAHTPNESVSLSDVVSAAISYALMARNWRYGLFT